MQTIQGVSFEPMGLLDELMVLQIELDLYHFVTTTSYIDFGAIS